MKLTKKQRKEKREKLKKQRLTYRARKRGALVIIPFSRTEVIERDGLVCYLCGKILELNQVTIDHYIPLSEGGAHCLENARIACKKCNVEKSNKLIAN